MSAVLPRANKVNLAYFLFNTNISLPTRNAQVAVLVDTGASEKLIDMCLDRSLELELAPEEHVLGESSKPI